MGATAGDGGGGIGGGGSGPPGDSVGGAETCGQTLRNLNKQVVTGGVAQTVVEDLELVYVNE